MAEEEEVQLLFLRGKPRGHQGLLHAVGVAVAQENTLAPQLQQPFRRLCGTEVTVARNLFQGDGGKPVVEPFPVLFGGAVIVEQLFSWPGLGLMTMSAILNRDYPVIMGVCLLSAVVVLVANLVTDIVYAIVNPAIQYE